MLIRTLALLFLVAGQACGQTITIPLNPVGFLSSLTGGAGSRPGSSTGSNKKQKIAEAERDAYLNYYYNEQLRQIYEAQYAQSVQQYQQNQQFMSLYGPYGLYGLYGPYGPYGPYGANSNVAPGGPPPTRPPTTAPVTSAPSTGTSPAIPGVGGNATSPAIPGVGGAATSPAIPTTAPLTSPAIPGVGGSETSPAIPGRAHTTPMPFHYVPNSPISPYDLHRIGSNPIYVRESAVASSSAQGSPVYIPYNGIYRGPQPASYLAFAERK